MPENLSCKHLSISLRISPISGVKTLRCTDPNCPAKHLKRFVRFAMLRQRVKVLITDEKGEKELAEYKVEDLHFRPRRKKEKVKMDDELKRLEALEKKERKSKL